HIFHTWRFPGSSYCQIANADDGNRYRILSFPAKLVQAIPEAYGRGIQYTGQEQSQTLKAGPHAAPPAGNQSSIVVAGEFQRVTRPISFRKRPRANLL